MRNLVVLLLVVVGLAWAAGGIGPLRRRWFGRTIDGIFAVLFSILAISELSLLVGSWAELTVPLRALYAGAGLLFVALAVQHGGRWARRRDRSRKP